VDYETVWSALEEWREQNAGDVAIESVGAGWLCRLQSLANGIAPALCHGADATTAVQGALAVLSSREVREAQSAPRRDDAEPGAATPPESRVAARALSRGAARGTMAAGGGLRAGRAGRGPRD
jgi:hypothetical protein